MAHPGLAAAGTVFEIDEDLLAIVTEWTESTDVTEEEVTGTGDVIGDPGEQISFQVFRPTAVGQTYAISGNIHYEDGELNDGLDTLNTKKLNGQTFKVTSVDQKGYGVEFDAFITGFERTGTIPGLWQFSADLRVVSIPEDIEGS